MRVGLLTCLLLPSSFEAAVAQDILGIDRRERFRIYATGEHRPSFAYPGSVKVGTVLPDDGGGVSYDVPPGVCLARLQRHRRERSPGAGGPAHAAGRRGRRSGDF